MNILTQWGKQAKEGDYVLVGISDRFSSSVKVLPAKVHNGKAYTAETEYKSGSRRWIRKESCVVVIDEAEVDNDTKKLIEMNIQSKKSALSPEEIETVFFIQRKRG